MRSRFFAFVCAASLAGTSPSALAQADDAGIESERDASATDSASSGEELGQPGPVDPPSENPQAPPDLQVADGADGAPPEATGALTAPPVMRDEAALPPLPEGLGVDALPPLPEDPSVLPTSGTTVAVDESRWLAHRIVLSTSVWPGELPSRVRRAWLELEYQPRLAGELGAGFRAVAEALLRFSQSVDTADPEAEVSGNGVRLVGAEFATNRDRQRALVRELALSWSGSGAEMAVGWQILSWGRADGVRPLDLFMAHDRTDPLRSETLGLPSITCSFARDAWTIEGVWVPSTFTDFLPVHRDNAWANVANDERATLRAAKPRFDLREAELGGRLSYSDHDWDLALVSASTHDRTPSLLRIAADQGQQTVNILAEHRRSLTYGASAVRVLGAYLVKLDVAYVDYRREARRILNDGVRLVAGGEARGSLGEGGTYTAVVQYALDTTTPGKVRAQADLLSSPYHWFRHAALGTVRFAFPPRWEAKLELLVELVHGGVVPNARLDYHPTDGVALFCEGSIITGPRDTWLDRLDHADRFVVGTSFNTK